MPYSVIGREAMHEHLAGWPDSSETTGILNDCLQGRWDCRAVGRSGSKTGPGVLHNERITRLAGWWLNSPSAAALSNGNDSAQHSSCKEHL